VCHNAWSQESVDIIELLPDTKVFPSFTADALAHRVSLSRVIENRDWIGSIGGSSPIFGIALTNAQIQFSIAASTFSRLIHPPGITVYTVDYKVDFPLDVHLDELDFRLALGHFSGHFADDGIEVFGRSSIQYVKDYLLIGLAREVGQINGHVYATGTFSFRSKPVHDKRWQVQLGVEGGNISITDEILLYGAMDVKLKEEVAWGSTQSYQVGAKCFARGGRALRVAYTHRTGFEERGQFFDQRETVNLISLFIDF
jgi:hypothetical protein